MINRPKLFIFSLVIVFIYGITNVVASQNLVRNSGFEEGERNQAKYWQTEGSVFWVEDEVFSGNKAMKLALAEIGTASITSNLFRVMPHTKIELSAWVKAQNIGLIQAASGNFVVELNYYEADRITQIEQVQLLSTYGSFDWKKINDSLITPTSVHYMSVSLRLVSTTGTIWVDNVTITQTATPSLKQQESHVSNPVIIPQPWQTSLSRESLPIKSVAILNSNQNPQLMADIRATFNQLTLPYRFLNPTQSTKAYNTLIYLGDSSSPEINAYLQTQSTVIPFDWSQLGDQGYMLAIVPDSTQRMAVYLGGNTDLARFYAFQTLKQLMEETNNGLYPTTIIDWPSLPQRGVTVTESWLEPDPTPLFKRLAQVKFNFIWLRGAYLNQKFGDHWQMPLNEAEKATIQTYLKLAEQHFVTPYFALEPHTQNTADPNFYTDEINITLAVEKFRVLYGLGIRHFGLSFNNIPPKQPQSNYLNNEIGVAHSYFISQVYERLTADFTDITLMIVPMDDRNLGNKGDIDEAYLKTLGQLPDDIGFYTSAVFLEDAQAAIRLTNRTHLIRDDLWASAYQVPAPDFVVPLERTEQFNAEIIQGYTFSPLEPTLEDVSLTSWFTAADYAWAPERYTPSSTFELVVAKHVGVKNRSDFVPTIDTPTITLNKSVTATGLISITTKTPNVAIHYTLDGNIPTLDSPIYSEPIQLPNVVNVRLKAVAYRAGYNDSGVTSIFFNQRASQALATIETKATPLSKTPATQVVEPSLETETTLPIINANEPNIIAGQTSEVTTVDSSSPTNPYSSVSISLSSIAVEGWRIWLASVGFIAVVLGASIFMVRQRLGQSQANSAGYKMMPNTVSLPEKSQFEVLFNKIEAMLQESRRKSVPDTFAGQTSLLEEVADLDTTSDDQDKTPLNPTSPSLLPEVPNASTQQKPISGNNTVNEPTIADTDAAEYRKVLALISQQNFVAAQDHIFMYFLSEGKHNYRDVAVLFARLVTVKEAGGKIRITHFYSPLLNSNVILGLLLLVGISFVFGLVIGEWVTVAGLLALPLAVWISVLVVLWGSAFTLLYAYLRHRKKKQPV